MNSSIPNWQQVCDTFRQIWGYETFRPPQGEIIQCLLKTQDAVVVMPTGGGKSVCFQLPALLQQGVTLVISPLVALMEDQAQQLQQRGLKVGLLHNELPRMQRQGTLNALERQELRLLYLSPETLLSPPVWERLIQPHLKINGMIIDEAHCLTQWGTSFRPTYYRLGAVRPALLRHKPSGSRMAIAAFTATADTHTQSKIEQILQLDQPQKFLLSPYRPNLHLQVQTTWTLRCRRSQLLEFIRPKKGQSGLIYVRSRRDSETLSQWLKSLNYATAPYHAGLSSQQRRFLEARWLENALDFVVCTSAFGLGINKPDVRWVVHFQAPYLLCEYLQEVGRGGRDGQPTTALALVSEPTGWLDSTDQQRRKFLVNQLYKQYQQTQQIAKKLPHHGEIATVARQFRGGEMALALLYDAHRLQWLDPFHYQFFPNQSQASLVHFNVEQQQLQLQMMEYLRSNHCRWQYILKTFGFTEQAKGFRCGHCDNCSRQR